jgi:sec-independent protein translocase protein TatB
MFDIGWSELMVIGALALIVVGPRDLPKMLRTLGQYVAQARGMAREFQRSMEDAAREADLTDVKGLRDAAADLRKLRNAPYDAIGAASKPKPRPAGNGAAAAAPAKPAAPQTPPAAAQTAAQPAPSPAPAPASDDVKSA